MIYKPFKFRLYPDKERLNFLNRCFEYLKFIYNYYLSIIENNGYHRAYTNIQHYVNNLKYQYHFLQKVNCAIIIKTLFHLGDNLKRYYNHSFGYPKYKNNFLLKNE